MDIGTAKVTKEEADGVPLSLIHIYKKFYSLAMGCQMNAHDSEKLEGMLDEMGYERTQEETEADFIIYNTCCVRENAELKVYGKLGWLKHYKKENPNAVVALCGCMMQQDTFLLYTSRCV